MEAEDENEFSVEEPLADEADPGRVMYEMGKEAQYTNARFEPYPTPRQSPSAMMASDQLPKPEPLNVAIIWQAAFVAGTLGGDVGKHDGKPIDKANLQRKLAKGECVVRSQLPKLPRSHREVLDYELKEQFLKAEEDHLISHQQMKSWKEVAQADCGKDKLLDCMWVYVYKFDKHGRFKKCKARLVVRGDQQARSKTEDTYAAILAGRSFRALMATAARFDLELIQYDAVNAFVNAKLTQDVYMRMPPGYRTPGTILKLEKALYGLRISPLLWQRELQTTLTKMGFQTVPHEPCCLIRQGILIFFYVDDIIIVYRKKQETAATKAAEQLKARYQLTGGDDLQWFLGIEIIRDRERHLVYLSQSSYIEKISRLAEKTDQPCCLPMKQVELLPRMDRAEAHEIQRYQRKVGSIMYAAVTTWPDVAFACSRISRFLTNPSNEHQLAADQVLLYLKRTRNYALRLGGADNLTVASDASFADNTIDRKSSQAYTISLFGGLISWRANKQDTVTTSTTEAELLALSQAAKESLFVSRLLNELTIRLEDQQIHIQCDNAQTIRLVNAEIAQLQTKLRHVDIHNHWLRQEIANKRIRVTYVESKGMTADGLTKALPVGSWPTFLAQLGLIDVTDQIAKRREAELREVRVSNEGDSE